MTNGAQLLLEQCPQCKISRPVLLAIHSANTVSFDGSNSRIWTVYKCSTCGGVTLTVAAFLPSNPGLQHPIQSIWPAPVSVPIELPSRAQQYLKQAHQSRHAPAGAIMLAASAVDAMLKDKGYKQGTLNNRIDEAAKAHLITDDMAAWAHEIRLDANDQRHADEEALLPTDIEAAKTLGFADALAQFLYVLPAMVSRGRNYASEGS
jgi:hypothetical protein